LLETYSTFAVLLYGQTQREVVKRQKTSAIFSRPDNADYVRRGSSADIAYVVLE
jgi:hypothetical protein